MSPNLIVSYDDTHDDHDALMLGRLLRDAGATLTLAYVRHAVQANPDRERRADREARALLARGAAALDDPDVERRVVVSPSTGEGLGQLAGTIGAEAIVFGSDYRTPRGRVAVGHTAQTLLENGPVALALAPAGYALAGGPLEPGTIGILPGTADEAAIETAYALAERFAATVVGAARDVGLLVVGSRREARAGHVMVTSSAANTIAETTAPVLVVARGVGLSFQTLVTA